MQVSELLLILGVSIGCVSCGALDQINQPLEEGVTINPLDFMASSNLRPKPKKIEADATGESFLTGDYVETVVPNTPFFDKYPGSGAPPTKVLAQGLVLRVVTAEGAYLKVQNEEGEEGYVANVMVVPQGLLVGGAPLPDLPPVEPGESPNLDELPPEPEIPGIEAPVPVDPDATIAPPVPADPDAPSIDEPTPPNEPKEEDPVIAPEPEIPGIEE